MHISKVPLLAVGRNVSNTGAALRYHINDTKHKNNLNTKKRVLELNLRIEKSIPNLLHQDINFSGTPNKFLSILEMNDYEIKTIRDMLNKSVRKARTRNFKI